MAIVSNIVQEKESFLGGGGIWLSWMMEDGSDEGRERDRERERYECTAI